jgi:hypothetical protein
MFIKLSNGELINTDHIANVYRDDYTPGRPWALVYGHTLRHYSQEDYDKIEKATLPGSSEWQGCDGRRYVALSEFDKRVAVILRSELHRDAT